MDRAALEASVHNTRADVLDSAGKLDSVVGEINELHVRTRDLREQLEAAQGHQLQVRSDLIFVLTSLLSTVVLSPSEVLPVPA